MVRNVLQDQIIEGNASEILDEFADGSVHCCVTSPPYYGLRQYLFDKAVILRYDLSDEKRRQIEKELRKRGIKPKL